MSESRVPKRRQPYGFSGGLGDIMRGTAWVYVAQILVMALGFGTTMIVASWYGKEATGLLALTTASATMFASVAVFGQATYLVRRFGVADTNGDSHLKRRIYDHTLRLSLTIALVLAGPAVLLLLQALPGTTDLSLFLVGVILALALFGQTFILLTVQIIRTLAPPRTYALFLLVPALLSLGIIWVWGVNFPRSLLLPSAALGVSTLFTGFAALRFNTKRLAQNGPTETGEALPSGRALMRLGFPYFVVTGAAMLVLHGNMIAAGFLLPTADLGVYAVAFKLSFLASFGLSTVTQVVQPKLALLSAQGGKRALQKYAQQASRVVLLASAPIILGLFLGRTWLVSSAFGPAFSEASTVLGILLIGQSIDAFTGVTTAYLSMSNGQRILAIILGFSALMGAVLTAILAPVFGPIGPAIALSASLAFWNLSALVAIRVRDGFWLFALSWTPGDKTS